MSKIQEKSREFDKQGMLKETQIFLRLITVGYLIILFVWFWIILGLFGFPIPFDLSNFYCGAWGCGLIKIITILFSIKNPNFNWVIYSFLNICICWKVYRILIKMVWAKETQNHLNFRELVLFISCLIVSDLLLIILAKNL